MTVRQSPASDTGALSGDLLRIASCLAPVLRALSDENRLAIMLAITERPRSVKELTDLVGLPQTLVSHHLKALRDVGLVGVTAQGRSNIYAMCCATLAEPARLLSELAAGRLDLTTSRQPG